jgi:C4-dicarboxylate-specific signal transduction histidine kinase
MKVQQNVSIKKYTKVVSAFLAGAVIALGSATNVSADPISSETQAHVDQYKKKLTEWAANPGLIAAVKDANAKGGLAPGMTNPKWDDLKDTDPVVTGFQSSEASKYLKTLEADKGINKLYARDQHGNLVAGSNKPALFNNAARPPFKNAMEGKAYADSEVKEDPTTRKRSVQVSVPIMSEGKPIGVLHTAVNAN